MIMILIVLFVVASAVILFESVRGAIPSTDPTIQKIAQAIAFAEGFYVSGSRPQRNNNPGDMTADLIGKSTGKDGPFVVFSNVDDGWNNLYAQIQLWLNGGSSHADSSSTIQDISGFYTTTDQAAWASNVANKLGVSIDTPIGEVS